MPKYFWNTPVVLCGTKETDDSRTKDVISSISYPEQHPFKIPQLPALRTVVNEPAQQKHRFVLLLYSQSIGSPSILGENVFQQPPMTCVTRCWQGLQGCFGGQRIPPQPHSPRTAARMAKQRSAVFVLLFCPSGRAKWVRASAWNCPRL